MTTFLRRLLNLWPNRQDAAVPKPPAPKAAVPEDAPDADVFRRTTLGLGLSLLLVALFYNLLANETEQVVRSKQASKAETKLKNQHDRDSIRNREDAVRHEVVAALLKHGAAETAAPNAQSTVKKDVSNSKATVKETGATASATTATPKEAPAVYREKTTPLVPPELKPPPADAQRRWLQWLLPLLALAGAGVLAWGGWVVWRQSRPKPAEAPPGDKDPPLLKALLQAYAGHIGRVLPNPRQVKRFAAKARLQNNLLVALQKSTATPPHGKSPFQFGPAQQILAFLLLLLIEQETSRENKLEATRPAGVPAPARLRDLSEEDFVEQMQTLFSNWHRTGLNGAASAAFASVMAALRRTSYIPYQQLASDLTAPAGQRLLVQLHRLNTGLLV